MSTPQTTIYVCSGVLLNNSYNNTIWFNDLSAQRAYFMGKVVRTFPAYSYVRKSWTVNVDATMEQARTWNYLFFNNGAGKTYYYFINNIEYKNDSTVELFLELDVLQTYHLEYVLHPSFVEREHTVSDEPGEHLLDEGLELGQYTTLRKEDVTELQELCIVLLASVNVNDPSDDAVYKYGQLYNNQYSGLTYYAARTDDYVDVGKKLDNLGSKTDGVIGMFMYPKTLIRAYGSDGIADSWAVNPITHDLLSPARAQEVTILAPVRPTTLDGYVPKNKKLLTYPYNVLYVTNNTGGSAVYRYERFTNPANIRFNVVGALGAEASTKMYPLNYEGVESNYDSGISGVTFPSCAWDSDTYKLWLAQNQNQQNHAFLGAGLTIAGGVGALVASAWTGGMTAAAGVGAIAGGASQIAGLLAQREDMKAQPPQAHGTAGSSVNITNNSNTYTFYLKCVDAEHARVIDDYFTMYGYKANKVKIPSRNVRPHWTYTKTVGCNVSGNLCNEDLAKIASIFDKGVTFWKNGDNIGNYALDNTV